MLVLANPAADGAPPAARSTMDVLGVQVLEAAAIGHDVLDVARDGEATAGTVDTLALPSSPCVAAATAVGRSSDDCCRVCTGFMAGVHGGESSDVAGMRSTLPRVSVHFTNVDETTPFELTTAGAFLGVTSLGAMLTSEGAPGAGLGAGAKTTVLAGGTLFLAVLQFFRSGFGELAAPTPSNSTGQGSPLCSVSGTLLPTLTGFISICATISQGCLTNKADVTTGNKRTVVPEVCEHGCEVRSSGET